MSVDRLAASGGASFDVVVANILAGPLKVLAPLLCERVAPAGHLVLAGILFSRYLYKLNILTLGDYFRMDLRRKELRGFEPGPRMHFWNVWLASR